jgi:hypothetical protein
LTTARRECSSLTSVEKSAVRSTLSCSSILTTSSSWLSRT